jgi:hypothetical protein
MSKFTAITSRFETCEDINDNYDTAPSKRIEALCAYKKGKSSNAHAWQIFKRGRLESVRGACPHFSDWLSKLERLKL